MIGRTLQLIPILDPLAHTSCLSLMMLCEKIVASQLSLSAFCTVYCGGEGARKAARISGHLIIRLILTRISLSAEEPIRLVSDPVMQVSNFILDLSPSRLSLVKIYVFM